MGMTLAEALALADTPNPTPDDAAAALRVLRQSLADALGLSLAELAENAQGTPWDSRL